MRNRMGVGPNNTITVGRPPAPGSIRAARLRHSDDVVVRRQTVLVQLEEQHYTVVGHLPTWEDMATPAHSDAPASQDYYSTDAWQREERTALAELERGEGRHFDSAAELIAWLDADD